MLTVPPLEEIAVSHRTHLAVLLAALSCLAAPVVAQKALEAPDYGQWESLRGSGTLSPDGKWIAYTVSKVDGDSEIRLRQLGSEDSHTFKHGSRGTFSEDGRWFGYSIGVSESQREKLTKAKKPIRNKFALRDLASGKTHKVDAVRSFSFSEDGRFVALARYGAKGKKGGSDVVVRRLDGGSEISFGNVGAHSWSERASLLAMVIDTADEVGGGVSLYDADRGIMRSLDSAKARYTALRWRDDAADLAFLKITEHDKDDDEQPSHVIVAWRDLDAWGTKTTYDHREDSAFPKDMRVMTNLLWHDDGDAVFFGIRDWDRRPEPKKDDDEADDGDEKNDGDKGEEGDEENDDDEKDAAPKADKDGAKGKKQDKPKKSLRDSLKDPAGVDVWHARDVKIIPRQKKTAARDRNKSQLCALWLDDEEFVRLGDGTVDSVSLLEGSAHALGRDTTRHERLGMFGPYLFDAYVIETRTGKRKRVLEQHKFAFGSSPDGRFVLYVKNQAWHSYDVLNDRHHNLTGKLDGAFINDERNTLTDENPPYGVAGWTLDGAVIINGRYDLWRLVPDGSHARRLTKGAATRTRYRLLDLDPEEDHIDATQPVYVSIYGDTTKQSGFGRLDARQGGLDVLHLADAHTSALQKAKNADVFAFSAQTSLDSPDIFVSTRDLTEPRQISKTNPQQKDFAWSPRSELVNYKNDHGQELQGSLFYPAGYEAGKKYPMIVYIYEMRSQNLHRYTAPSERRPYNPSVFTTQGYFVFQPDIVYRPQNPGLSALECVVPAVKTVLAKGAVDPARVGLVGHSWGAYQTAFIVTRSNLFAAGVAGAPLTNMMSMSMSIYWNSGGTDARIFHESQGRMDKPFWQDVETYISNSPIFGMDTLETPLLVAFGDEDGAVDWHQGVEMYNAARLASKQFVMLVYAGENHGLAKKPNQVDYHWRVREWFDTYVKGHAAPKWIAEGTSYIEREDELKEKKRKNKKDKPSKKTAPGETRPNVGG